MAAEKPWLSYWPYWILFIIFWSIALWQGIKNCEEKNDHVLMEEINQMKSTNK